MWPEEYVYLGHRCGVCGAKWPANVRDTDRPTEFSEIPTMDGAER